MGCFNRDKTRLNVVVISVEIYIHWGDICTSNFYAVERPYSVHTSVRPVVRWLRVREMCLMEWRFLRPEGLSGRRPPSFFFRITSSLSCLRAISSRCSLQKRHCVRQVSVSRREDELTEHTRYGLWKRQSLGRAIRCCERTSRTFRRSIRLERHVGSCRGVSLRTYPAQAATSPAPCLAPPFKR